MTTKDHGKAISKIYINDNAESFFAETSVQKLSLSATHHGDHDEFWVVLERDGIEVTRVNCRAVLQIVWKPENSFNNVMSSIPFNQPPEPRSELLLEMDRLLEKAKANYCCPETIRLIQLAIEAQELGDKMAQLKSLPNE